ncbi:MAG TPA: ceramidase domain-containing protein [Burkholderiales bacterium]
MDYHQALDLYCERTDPLFWSEPLNAISNGAFIVAAVVLLMRTRATRCVLPWDIAVLAGLIALVGLGSFVFHTVATVWASLLDVLFIEIYIYVYFARFLQRVGGLSPVRMIIGLVLFALFERLLTGMFVPGSLNGSYRYLPALIVLAGMALYALRARPALFAPLGMAVIVFCISLGLRTIDMAACAINPLGTHFLWHLLNALVLYCATVALSRSVPARAHGVGPI